MNRLVRVWQHADPPIIDLFLSPDADKPLREQTADLRATRLWMAAAPPDETGPSYACVVAEIYDGDLAQKDRPKLLLDETVGLDPADFTDDECEKYAIYPPHIIEKIRAGDLQHEETTTLGNYRRGVVALKDLYRPNMLFVPGQGLDWSQETYAREIQTNKFFRQIVYTEGLQIYDTRFEDDFEKWFPFGGARHRIGIQTVREDADFDQRIVDNLFAIDALQVASTCRLFHARSTWAPIRRALAIVLAQMQDQDLTYQMREWDEGEKGYTEAAKMERDEKEALERAMDEAIADAAFQAGIDIGVAPEAMDEDDPGGVAL